MMKNESALLNDAKKFDRDALVTIFDTYAPAIYKYALRLRPDPLESDNLVGDVFSALLEQFALGNGPVTNLKSYLYQMAYHLIVDRARHNSRHINIENAGDAADRMVDSPIQIQLEERVLMEGLVSALKNNLTELQQHVIVLRFLEGFSTRETAMIINKKENHVRAIQNRGIAKLRKALHLHLAKDRLNLSA